jgi:uncharacterized membrane protein (DUF485 family)
MEHGPNIKTEDFGSEYKTRIGLRLFFLYASFYLGFVGINTFAPRIMEVPVFFGINLAVSFGLLLIIAAFILGMIYNHLCTKEEDRLRLKKYGKEAAK